MESKNKTQSFPYLMVILILLLVGVGVFFASVQSTKFTIELNLLDAEYFPFPEMITFDVSVKVSHTGYIDCILEDMTLELTVNGIDCGSIASDSVFDRFSSDSITYTTTFGVLDRYDASILEKYRSYSAVIRLKAKAKAGIFSTFIEKTASDNLAN
jgi:hypothetical protein